MRSVGVPFLAIFLVASSAVALLVGPIDVDVSDIWDGLVALLGSSPATLEADVVSSIRMPRVLAASGVGAALGIGGVVSQSAYRNLLAEPFLLGVSSAAGFGLLIGTFFSPVGWPALVPMTIGIGLAVAVALGIQRFRDRLPYSNGLVLVGVAVGFTFLAWTLLVTFGVESPRLPTFTYFIFGSLSTATWPNVLFGIIAVAVSAYLVMKNAKRLDIFSLGDREAASLGVDTVRLPRLILISMSVMVGASVLMGGVVGFVGLLAPTLGRRLVGSLHRSLLPASGLLGALIVLWAHIGIRSTPFQVEVPLGVITAALGGPLLVGLLLRKRATS